MHSFSASPMVQLLVGGLLTHISGKPVRDCVLLAAPVNPAGWSGVVHSEEWNWENTTGPLLFIFSYPNILQLERPWGVLSLQMFQSLKNVSEKTRSRELGLRTYRYNLLLLCVTDKWTIKTLSLHFHLFFSSVTDLLYSLFSHSKHAWIKKWVIPIFIPYRHVVYHYHYSLPSLIISPVITSHGLKGRTYWGPTSEVNLEWDRSPFDHHSLDSSSSRLSDIRNFTDKTLFK